MYSIINDQNKTESLLKRVILIIENIFFQNWKRNEEKFQFILLNYHKLYV